MLPFLVFLSRPLALLLYVCVIPLPISGSVTNPALSFPSRINEEVISDQIVPSNAFALSTINSGGSDPSKGINPLRGRFEVAGVNTMSDSAQVVEYESPWCFAFDKFVSYRMGCPTPPSTVLALNVDTGVPVAESPKYPFPTASFLVDLYSGEEPLLQGHSHKCNYTDKRTDKQLV